MTGAVLLAFALAADGGPAVQYEVTCGPRCAELGVEAAASAAAGNRFVIESGFGPYLKDAQYEDGGRWVAAEVRGDEVVAARCRSRACRVRYRLRLAEAARQMRDRDRAFAQDGMLIAPPSVWLLRPQRTPAGEPVPAARGAGRRAVRDRPLHRRFERSLRRPAGGPRGGAALRVRVCSPPRPCGWGSRRSRWRSRPAWRRAAPTSSPGWTPPRGTSPPTSDATPFRARSCSSSKGGAE